MQKQRAIKNHTRKMQHLFEAADESCDGSVDLSEFTKILEDESVRTWLAAQELDASDAATLFQLLDKGNNSLDATDLVKGVSQLKGSARSIDLQLLIRKHGQLEVIVGEVYKKLSCIQEQVMSHQ